MTQRDPKELTLVMALSTAALGVAVTLAHCGKRLMDRISNRFSDTKFFDLKNKK